MNKPAHYSPAMISGTRTALALLGVCLVVSVGRGVAPENPYHTIVDRNPFGLNPPIVTTNQPDLNPPKNVKFNGITKAGGHKRAFFTIPGKEPKDPPQYVTLGEGEKADVLEVSKIFEDEGEVEVVNAGIKMVLNFKNNGNKNAVIAPQPNVGQPAPPVPQPIPGNPAAAVYNPNANNPVVVQPPSLENPAVPPPAPNFNPNPNVNQANQVPPAPPEGSGLKQIPTRTLRLNPMPAPPSPP